MKSILVLSLSLIIGGFAATAVAEENLGDPGYIESIETEGAAGGPRRRSMPPRLKSNNSRPVDPSPGASRENASGNSKRLSSRHDGATSFWKRPPSRLPPSMPRHSKTRRSRALRSYRISYPTFVSAPAAAVSAGVPSSVVSCPQSPAIPEQAPTSMASSCRVRGRRS